MTRFIRNRVEVGDASKCLARLPDASVDMLLTSPPYFRLRNYQIDGQLGLEPTVAEWVEHLASVARQAARVLTPTGSFWLNVADTYSLDARQGAARKSLLLGPERLAIRLVEEGWILRNKVVWQKANPMPSSVKDRLSCTWEALYVFVRSPSYFFDLDAIRLPHTSQPPKPRPRPVRATGREAWRGPNGDDASGLIALKAQGRVGHPLGKNPGDVWRIASSGYKGAHHATFPVRLAERSIAAGCPEVRCRRCQRPWSRPLARTLGSAAMRGVLTPTCTCAIAVEPGLVLDPFLGAGTTALAAENLKRDWLGIELNPAFAALAERRLRAARSTEQPAA